MFKIIIIQASEFLYQTFGSQQALNSNKFIDDFRTARSFLKKYNFPLRNLIIYLFYMNLKVK